MTRADSSGSDGTEDAYGAFTFPVLGLNWYALRIRSNFERTVSENLALGGFERFWPSYFEKSSWSDRQKIIERSLFPGYLFARFNLRDLVRILAMPGIVHVLDSNLSPRSVSSDEMLLVRRIAAAPSPLPASFAPGDLVTVERGPCAGLRGVLLRSVGSTRLVITVASLHASVSVEIESSSVALCR